MRTPDHRTVAIVGRPNVGKSALFNRLAGKKISIVHDQPGVTRDRLSAICRLGKEPFTIIDTGGIGSTVDGGFSYQVHAEVDIAIEVSQALLFVVDAQDGLTPVDEELARKLRRANRPTILVVNKIDVDKHQPLQSEFTRLGFETLLAVSAEHGRGIGELVECTEALLPPADEIDETAESPVSLAIVGRPNVGKSSLINALLRDRRTLVSDVAGTTRDAVDVPYERDGRSYTLIDTAGIRPRGKHGTSVEVFSVMRAERSIRRADLCVIVIDATAKVTAQDKKIAGLIQEANKPCVIALNKWDLVTFEGNRRSESREFVQSIRAELFFLEYASITVLSAKTGENVGQLFGAIEETRTESMKKIGTGPLNRAIREALAANPPPARRGKRFNILYATQVNVEKPAAIPPPTFVFFVNDPATLAPTYRRYLEARLRELSPFTGLPLLLRMRGREKRGR
ncbi:MAG: ribosome biogenesis GTPase Der [Verrucomicrobiota bacterium]|nr:ribosome biogenesis GTPase Der [Verrucomicrobiota bacterium]